MQALEGTDGPGNRLEVVVNNEVKIRSATARLSEEASRRASSMDDMVRASIDSAASTASSPGRRVSTLFSKLNSNNKKG